MLSLKASSTESMLNAFFFNTPLEDYYFGHQAAEIFKDNVYGKYLVDKKDLTILDVGGNIGLASYYFSKFAKVVHTFEPAQEHYEVLTKQLEFNKLTNVIPYKLALSNTDGEATFYHLGNKTMYSLRPAAIDNTRQHEKVKTIRLDTFFKQANIDHVDFMKIDIEGEEYNVLCGDGFQNIADKVDMVFVETHSWANRHPNQLIEAFRINGFKKIETIPNDATLIVALK